VHWTRIEEVVETSPSNGSLIWNMAAARDFGLVAVMEMITSLLLRSNAKTLVLVQRVEVIFLVLKSENKLSKIMKKTDKRM